MSLGKSSKRKKGSARDANPLEARRAALNSIHDPTLPNMSITAGNGPLPNREREKKTEYVMIR